MTVVFPMPRQIQGFETIQGCAFTNLEAISKYDIFIISSLSNSCSRSC